MCRLSIILINNIYKTSQWFSFLGSVPTCDVIIGDGIHYSNVTDIVPGSTVVVKTTALSGYTGCLE